MSALEGKPGRPSPIWDQNLCEQLFQLIEIGNYIGTACQAVGVHEMTYHRWMREGRLVYEGLDDDYEKIEAILNAEIVHPLSPMQCRCCWFYLEATKASAKSEAYAVTMIRQQMPQQWTAAMTFLERRFPGRWKRKEQLDIGQGESEGGIDEEALLRDPEAVRLMHEALERASKGELPAPAEIQDAVVVDDETTPAENSPRKIP